MNVNLELEELSKNKLNIDGNVISKNNSYFKDDDFKLSSFSFRDPEKKADFSLKQSPASIINSDFNLKSNNIQNKSMDAKLDDEHVSKSDTKSNLSLEVIDETISKYARNLKNKKLICCGDLTDVSTDVNNNNSNNNNISNNYRKNRNIQETKNAHYSNNNMGQIVSTSSYGNFKRNQNNKVYNEIMKDNNDNNNNNNNNNSNNNNNKITNNNYNNSTPTSILNSFNYLNNFSALNSTNITSPQNITDTKDAPNRTDSISSPPNQTHVSNFPAVANPLPKKSPSLPLLPPNLALSQASFPLQNLPSLASQTIQPSPDFPQTSKIQNFPALTPEKEQTKTLDIEDLLHGNRPLMKETVNTCDSSSSEILLLKSEVEKLTLENRRLRRRVEEREEGGTKCFNGFNMQLEVLKEKIGEYEKSLETTKMQYEEQINGYQRQVEELNEYIQCSYRFFDVVCKKYCKELGFELTQTETTNLEITQFQQYFSAIDSFISSLISEYTDLKSKYSQIMLSNNLQNNSEACNFSNANNLNSYNNSEISYSNQMNHFDFYKALEERVNMLEMEVNQQRQMNEMKYMHDFNEIGVKNDCYKAAPKFKNDLIVQKIRPKSGIKTHKFNIESMTKEDAGGQKHKKIVKKRKKVLDKSDVKCSNLSMNKVSGSGNLGASNKNKKNKKK